MHRSPETDTVLNLQLDDLRCVKQGSHFYLNCSESSLPESALYKVCYPVVRNQFPKKLTSFQI